MPTLPDHFSKIIVIGRGNRALLQEFWRDGLLFEGTSS